MGRASGKYERAKGRAAATDRFARMSHRLMESGAYRALSPNGRSLLLELVMMENGRNNGTSLFLSARDAADRMGVADPTTACAAFDELEALGFIACTVEAHFAVKCGAGSRARYWRLTWESVAGLMGPTHDYLVREPGPKTRARNRMIAGQRALKRWRAEQQPEAEAKNRIAVRDFPTHGAERVGKKHTTTHDEGAENGPSVGDFPTQFDANGGKPPNIVVCDFPTYTADQSGGASDRPENLEAENPSILSGGPSAAIEPEGWAHVRKLAVERWGVLDKRGREAWARSLQLEAGELRRYVNGGDLEPIKRVALRASLRAAA